jgi:IMP dehydrogenase
MRKIISMAKIELALAFDDVLLKPQFSTIKSRKDIDLKTKLTKNISLNIPLVSSNMDTVTEASMAIAMAQHGGIGIIHRYCTPEAEAEMVARVKRSESYVIHSPYMANAKNSISTIRSRIQNLGVKTYLVVDKDNTLQGILTSRDIKFANDSSLVEECMSSKLIVAFEEDKISIDAARQIMHANRIQKLPIVTSEYKLASLICLKDIERIKQRPLATLDTKGRLRCGAAVGIGEDTIARAKLLVDAGVDVLVVDVAHGHSQGCIDTVKKLKTILLDTSAPTIDVIAGNIATREGAEALIKAGADGIKCGIGSGGICTTRTVSGCGVPQFSALLDAAPICQAYGVPLISDGGNRTSGNICKALAAGASSVMLGRMLAGADESPGKIFIKDHRRVKIIRGMASYEANLSNAIRQGISEPDSIKSNIEGVQGYTAYTGPVSDTLTQIGNGIRSGISYCGARDIDELHRTAKFVRITGAGVVESGVHGVSEM